MSKGRDKEAGTAAGNSAKRVETVVLVPGPRRQQRKEPAPSGAKAAASSSKVVTARGASVTTISNGAHPVASKEPEIVTIKADPATALGVSFGTGGVVRQVAPKGQAAALGVRESWRLTRIVGKNDFPVTATSTPKSILEALATTRKKGQPYTLGFSTRVESGAGKGGEESGCRETGERNDVDNACVSAAVEREAQGGEPPESETGGGVKGIGGGAGGVSADDPPAGRGDGEVTLIYEMYNEKFPIKNGRLSSADIDETYCLSFVMPNCMLHLGPLSPSDRYAQENGGTPVPYVKEEPPGNFLGLVDGGVYWVYVSRDDEEEKQDRARMKQARNGMKQDLPEGGAGGERQDDGRNGLESCSCVYGNPCVDEYGCKDWHSRYAVAKTNGWKGF
ncbi:unnamed protein product [Scytosiphon promiscuus]